MSVDLNYGNSSHVGWVRSYPYVQTAPGDGSYFMLEPWVPGSWSFFWHSYPCTSKSETKWLENHTFWTFLCWGSPSEAMLHSVDTNGNVIYTGGQDKLINSFNGTMYANQCRTSADGRYDFCYQSDGNLVLYDGSTPLWASGTHGTSTGFVAMQGDGNLVVYDAGNVPRWSSGTNGQNGSFVVVQSNRCALMYSDDGSYIPWGTATCNNPGGSSQQPPIAPHYFSAHVSGSTVSLWWTPPPGPIYDYRLDAGSAPGLSNIVSYQLGNQSSYVVYGVGPGTYYARVTARNGGGHSPPSNEIAVVVY